MADLAARWSQEDEPKYRAGGGGRPRLAEHAGDLLPIYLREMGATPLINDTEEVRLAREMQEARTALAALARSLPSGFRRQVLNGDRGIPKQGHAWPFEVLEAFYDRLILHGRETRDPRTLAMVSQARFLRRRMEKARDALILANLRLVVHLAKRYVNNGLSMMDLIQEGNIGLMKAVEKFEHERGNKFSTYAFWWIKQAIERAIADKAKVIRIPVHVNEKLKKVRRATRELSERLGRRPTPGEIALRLDLPVETVEEILGVVQDPQSLDEQVVEGADQDVACRVADTSMPSPLETTSERQLKERIERMLKILTPREERILRLRFGIGNDAPHTLEEVGRLMGLSRERVRQLEAGALRKIQSSREGRHLHGWLR